MLHLAPPLRAQSGKWPRKPVKLVLGYPPGGATDGIARQVQARMEAQLTQPLIFDYRAGAGSTIAADYVARAAPDGYTLHIVDSGALTISPNARKLNYDPLSSFTPIGPICNGGTVLVAHPSLPVRDLAQLLVLLKAKPGALTFGTAGVGVPGHLAAELFQAMSYTEMAHVPYKGGAQAMVDLIGGQVPLLFASMGSAVPYIASGKIKALGVTSAQRATALPSVPTIAEQGLAGYEATTWFALVGPAKLPAEVVSRVGDALADALTDTAVRTAITGQGYEPAPGTPQQLHASIQADLTKWRKVIRDRKLEIE
ncbi:MAG: tripartite tricarboxylate transporter substrate binding protein [Burkholderiales bacterium]|nr:tripartite tricarboxylate transporter substrate binding protein [Burkholderiales bacterium]